VDRVHVLADRVSDAIECDVVVVVPTAVHEETRGLVGDDDVRVGEEEFDRG
jgi:hypothetical protein